MATNPRLFQLLAEVKQLAKEYYDLTNKPLGVTSEVSEFEAARLLGLELRKAREPGYDAIELVEGKKVKIQIKSRRLDSNSKSSQMIGSINIDDEWDTLLLVLLDEHFNATEMWEMTKEAVIKELQIPGSKARSERNALKVGLIKRLGCKRWPVGINETN